MDEKIKTRPLRFPAKENPDMEKALLDWPIRGGSRGMVQGVHPLRKKILDPPLPIILQYDVKVRYRLISREFSGMKFFHPSVRLTNQKPRAFVSVR